MQGFANLMLVTLFLQISATRSWQKLTLTWRFLFDTKPNYVDSYVANYQWLIFYIGNPI